MENFEHQIKILPDDRKSLTINIRSSNLVQSEWLSNLIYNESNVKEVHLHLGRAGEDFVSTLDYFRSILECLKNVAYLTIYFENFKFTNQIYGNHLELPTLEYLNCEWSNIEMRTLEIFYGFIKAPNLEVFKITKFSTDSKCEELAIIWNFIRNNSGKIWEIYLWNKDVYTFHWYPELLHFWYCEELKSGMLDFLKTRTRGLKEFKVHKMHDKNFYDRIFREAFELEHFETDSDLLTLYRNESIFNIKKLTVWNFEINLDRLERLKKIFPNLEVIRFVSKHVSDEEKIIVRNVFCHLKDVQKLKSNSCDKYNIEFHSMF